MTQIVRSTDISPEVIQAKQRLGIVGNTPALLEAVQRAIRVAPIDLSVLVTGESGSGKEFFPQIIHNFSSRKHSKYIAVNCGAIPEGTIDSELFGHEKGSFTGAVASRKGYFEEADGGTIFLDEVAELPLTTQARLLRVLESGEFLKVGSSTVQKTNIRVVAATNVDMLKAVAEGRFRQDLYYRLSTIQISVPPLRSRGEDILMLERKFASDFAERYRTPPIEISPDAARMLMTYPWPGNVRQLKNITEQIALFEAGTTVSATTLASYLPVDTTSAAQPHTSAPAIRIHAYEHEREMLFNLIFRLQGEIDDLRKRVDEIPATRPLTMQTSLQHPTGIDMDATPEHITRSLMKVEQHLPRFLDIAPVDTGTTAEPPTTLEDTERESIRRALERNDGRRKATARELNISERTLYRKIKEYGLE